MSSKRTGEMLLKQYPRFEEADTGQKEGIEDLKST